MSFDTVIPRRDALKGLAAASLVNPFTAAQAATPVVGDGAKPFSIHIFSKCLQFLNWTELAAVTADLGLDGVDLTVRPDGHVEPGRVKEDLPKAVEALRKRGIQCPMMTTKITKASDAETRTLLETAGKQGIRYYRMDWLSYPNDQSIPAAMKQFERQLADLAKLNQQLNVIGAYQNHDGTRFGSAIWDVAQVLSTVNSPAMGSQYDIRHAMVEGGNSWPLGLRLIQPHIRILAIKDFVWEKVNGQWKVINVPLGQGMVDFPAFFKLVKQYNLQVPLSFHVEHPLGGAQEGHRTISIPREEVYKAISKDLVVLRGYLKEAGL
ncbi:sugar phosphate isomerase/epimerase [Nibrella saemangeumensis]|uniref:Sugar phosphate isomerase/epimerase n=1 Tax=Nibrella saemangeumensis TaxID=1084526 RepID=A0ABP8NMF0_9BACT